MVEPRLPARFATRLNGVSRAPGYPGRFHRLASVGEVPATLVRQPANPADPNAIEVHAVGVLVGWIEAHTAARLAPHLDAGEVFVGSLEVVVNPGYREQPAAVVLLRRLSRPVGTPHCDQAWRTVAMSDIDPTDALVLLAVARTADECVVAGLAVDVQPEDIAERTGLTRHDADAALYRLAERGLVRRSGHAWLPQDADTRADAA